MPSEYCGVLGWHLGHWGYRGGTTAGLGNFFELSGEGWVLGHSIDQQSLHLMEDKVRALQEAPEPRCITDLLFLLRLTILNLASQRSNTSTVYSVLLLGLTESISSNLEYFFEPSMKKVPSFLPNSTMLINILSESKFVPDCMLIMLDVASLYSNIAHEDAIHTITTIYSEAHLNLSDPNFCTFKFTYFCSKNTIFI